MTVMEHEPFLLSRKTKVINLQFRWLWKKWPKISNIHLEAPLKTIFVKHSFIDMFYMIDF